MLTKVLNESFEASPALLTRNKIRKATREGCFPLRSMLRNMLRNNSAYTIYI